MPEFSAGAIWVEVDGKRLDEYGEKEKLISKEFEAKSCFVEVPDILSACKIRFNYQAEPSNPGGERGELVCFTSSIVVEKGETPRTSFHSAISKPAEDTFTPMSERGGPSFALMPIEMLDPGLSWREAQARPASRPCMLKVVVTPRRLYEGGGNGKDALSGFEPPSDLWQKEVADQHQRSWWGVAGPGRQMFYTVLQTGVKHVATHQYPQLSAVYQFAFLDMPCAVSLINRTGIVASVKDLPKTIFHRAGHPPALPPPTHKAPPSTHGMTIDGPSNQERSKPADKESGIASRYKQENRRLAELLAEKKAKVRRLEAERADGGALSRSGVKKRRIQLAAGEEIQIVGAAVGMDEVKEENKKEDKEEDKVQIKKEPGEDEV